VRSPPTLSPLFLACCHHYFWSAAVDLPVGLDCPPDACSPPLHWLPLRVTFKAVNAGTVFAGLVELLRSCTQQSSYEGGVPPGPPQANMAKVLRLLAGVEKLIIVVRAILCLIQLLLPRSL